MKKRAYVFPGQGSQIIGMGKPLFDKYPDLIQEANQQLGYSIEELCLKDPEKNLNKTAFTQPALYTVSVLSYLEKIENDKTKPDFLAGHSLGEYSALFAAGAFDFLTGLKLVQKRGELMSQAPRGAMAAILDIDQERVADIIARLNNATVELSNINAQTQCIISGLYDDVHATEDIFLKAGARFIPLNVNSAFHSRCMRDAREKFAQFIGVFSLNPLQIPVIANYSARPYPQTNYTHYLSEQITHPVRWYESISWLLAEGDIDFEEIGPNNVLSKMIFHIKKSPLVMEIA